MEYIFNQSTWKIRILLSFLVEVVWLNGFAHKCGICRTYKAVRNLTHNTVYWLKSQWKIGITTEPLHIISISTLICNNLFKKVQNHLSEGSHYVSDMFIMHVPPNKSFKNNFAPFRSWKNVGHIHTSFSNSLLAVFWVFSAIKQLMENIVF